MKRPTLPMQILLGVIVALAAGYLLNSISGLQSGLIATPALPGAARQNTAEPYITISGAWMVRVHVAANAQPFIEKVTSLAEGRISPGASGEAHLRLLGQQGEILHEITFPTTQIISGEKPKTDFSIVLILPKLVGEAQIELITPSGKADYVLH